MENKESTTGCATIKYKEKFVYDLGADGAFEFEDEKPIRVNRGVLAFHSTIFFEAFFGTEPKAHIKIEGFDRTSFKMFLDCLLGLKEYTLLDALMIYPIAKEYEVEESLEKCVIALIPEVMDESVCLVLNLTAFYEINRLTDYVINFVKTNYGIVNFLEEYSSVLELSAMLKLIENMDLNSLVWTLVYEWGESYLVQRNKSDAKTFFVENGILKKLSLSHFESVKALNDFHEISKKQLLCSEEILNLLVKSALEREKKLPDKSFWIKIDAGYSFKETIALKTFLFVDFVSSKNNLKISIRPNKILFDPETLFFSELKIKARYILRHLRMYYNHPGPKECWRDDIHFFYRETFTKNSPEDYLISSFAYSDEFDLNFVDDSEGPLYEFENSPLKKCAEIHSVELTYHFNSPCRILKGSLDQSKYSVDENDLYFVKNVAIYKHHPFYF